VVLKSSLEKPFSKELFALYPVKIIVPEPHNLGGFLHSEFTCR